MTGLAEYHDKRYMMLDHTARRNLELTETMRSGKSRVPCSVFWITPAPPWERERCGVLSNNRWQ